MRTGVWNFCSPAPGHEVAPAKKARPGTVACDVRIRFAGGQHFLVFRFSELSFPDGGFSMV
jgi:hypothetical protein